MHDRTVGRHALDDTAGGGAADRLDAEPDRRATRLALHALGKIVAVHDHEVGAQLLQLGCQLRAAHDVHRAQAALVGKHDQQAADGGVGDVLDHPVAALEIDEIRQHELRGRRVDAHHRGLPARCRRATGSRRHPSLCDAASNSRVAG